MGPVGSALAFVAMGEATRRDDLMCGIVMAHEHGLSVCEARGVGAPWMGALRRSVLPSNPTGGSMHRVTSVLLFAGTALAGAACTGGADPEPSTANESALTFRLPAAVRSRAREALGSG